VGFSFYPKEIEGGEGGAARRPDGAGRWQAPRVYAGVRVGTSGQGRGSGAAWTRSGGPVRLTGGPEARERGNGLWTRRTGDRPKWGPPARFSSYAGGNPMGLPGGTHMS